MERGFGGFSGRTLAKSGATILWNWAPNAGIEAVLALKRESPNGRATVGGGDLRPEAASPDLASARGAGSAVALTVYHVLRS